MSAWFDGGITLKTGDELSVSVRKVSWLPHQVVVLASGDSGTVELVMNDVAVAKYLRDELDSAIKKVCADTERVAKVKAV